MSALEKIDSLLSSAQSELSEEDAKATRDAIRGALMDLLPDGVRRGDSLSDIVDAFRNAEVPPATRRNVAMVLLRMIAFPRLLPKTATGGALHPKVVELLQVAAPDILRSLNIDQRAQTHEKIERLAHLDSDVWNSLSTISIRRASFNEFVSSRQEIEKAIKGKIIQAYLAPCSFDAVRQSISNLLVGVARVDTALSHQLADEIESLEGKVSQELARTEAANNKLIRDYYRPFLQQLGTALTSHRASLSARLRSDISASFDDGGRLTKRFPLHNPGMLLRITVPFENKGPGVARDLRAEVAGTDSTCVIENESMVLGDVKPGPFVVQVDLRVVRPMREVRLDILLVWRCLGRAGEADKAFCIIIGAQSPDVPWERLERLQPYSLAVARGNEFVGRQDALRRMAARLSGNHLRSFYITGQKRVGKSSLAQALIDHYHAITGRTVEEFIYKEWGEFEHTRAEETLSELGQQIDAALRDYLPLSVQAERANYQGSLAPLARLVDVLKDVQPDRRFVVVIDEFDEISPELYRSGALAKTLFLNLRTLSAKPNLAFILVGGERMNYVMSAQGDKLNRFETEALDSFTYETEWKDYEDLIRRPVAEHITWHDDAIRTLFAETNGHPYFTKLVCAEVFDGAVSRRDAEITSADIEASLPGVVNRLDVNVFAHYWKDAVPGGDDDVEVVALKRSRTLIGYARARRRGLPTDLEHILQNISGGGVSSPDIPPVIQNFCLRGILKEDAGQFRIKVRLFERWLLEKGVNILIADQLGEELAESRRVEEDAAYVQSQEIVQLTEKWPPYQGRPIGAEDVRAWLQQVGSNVDQRLLFKLLQRLRFFADYDVRGKLETAHRLLAAKTPVFVQKAKSDRRQDILVTYVDGPGKSGSWVAHLYAQQNRMSSQCVIEMNAIRKRLEKDLSGEQMIRGIVITDDFVGTGRSLSEGLERFIEENSDLLLRLNAPVTVVAVCGTSDGDRRLRNTLGGLSYKNVDVEIGEILDKKHYAFSDSQDIWTSESERERAQTLCKELGDKLVKRSPLGYGGQGLLVVFERNCPNNSLPIMSAEGKGENPWRPLFPRRVI